VASAYSETLKKGLTKSKAFPAILPTARQFVAMTGDGGMNLNETIKGADLTQDEIAAAEKWVAHALAPRGYASYTPEEQLVLAILAGHYRLQQRARGKKSREAAKKRAEYRSGRVNLLLRYVVDEKYREEPKSSATVMKIIELLDDLAGIEASDSQVRRDIRAALKLGPLPTG
jgi:hypothetical protein